MNDWQEGKHLPDWEKEKILKILDESHIVRKKLSYIPEFFFHDLTWVIVLLLPFIFNEYIGLLTVVLIYGLHLGTSHRTALERKIEKRRFLFQMQDNIILLKCQEDEKIYHFDLRKGEIF